MDALLFVPVAIAISLTPGPNNFCGLNNGIRMEVKTHGTSGALQLQLPMPFAVQVGDTFTIVPGCDHTKATCKAKFNNVVNFRGFSYVPGSDQTLLIGGQ